jgi:hypothetical protein
MNDVGLITRKHPAYVARLVVIILANRRAGEGTAAACVDRLFTRHPAHGRAFSAGLTAGTVAPRAETPLSVGARVVRATVTAIR